jgi:hypothetical protein
VATAAGERVPSPSFQVAAAVAIGLLALAVAVLTVLLAALYRQVGVLERRLAPRSFLALADEGPAIDRTAPSLPGASRRGPELVVFGSARCILCRELAPGLSALADDGLAVLPVDVDLDPGVAESFAVPGTPYAVLLVDGSVAAKGLVNTLEQVELLVDAGVGRVGARAVA